MSGFPVQLQPHWSRPHTARLRRYLPLDLAGRPVYLLSLFELGERHRLPDACAYTGMYLADSLRGYLELVGLWEGPGFAAVFGSDSINQATLHYGDLLPLAIHEISHHFDRADARAEYDAKGWDLTPHELTTAERTLALEAAFPESRALPWQGHETRWIRCALHLFSRAIFNGADIELEAVHVAGPKYGLSPAADYLAALGAEPCELVSMPIVELLRTDPPRPFVELWERDTQEPD